MKAKRFHHHLKALPRLLPIQQKVDRLGYLPAKTDWMRYQSPRIVFCFILEGQGRLHYGNRWYDIEAPCIMTHWPGVFEEYGPTPEGATWEELFMGYDLSLMPVFEAWGIHPAQQPVWPIASVHTVRRLADELIGYAQNIEERGVADRIDRICQRLLLESVLAQPALPETPYDAALDRIRDRVKTHLELAHDTAALAAECHMAEVTFRRYWKQRFRLPFKHDLITMRMQEACRLLVSTRMDIKAIAEQVGFEDARYFSHRFTTLIGMPATKYRKRFTQK